MATFPAVGRGHLSCHARVSTRRALPVDVSNQTFREFDWRHISEAFGRATRADTARVLQHSVSEGNETLHHLITALDLGYLTQEKFEELERLLEPVRKKTFNLLMTIRGR